MKTQKNPVSKVNASSKFAGSGSSRIADPKISKPLLDDEDDDDLDMALDDDLSDMNYDFDEDDDY